MTLEQARESYGKIVAVSPDPAKPRSTDAILSLFSQVNAARAVIAEAFDVAQTRCGQLRDAGKRQSAEYRQANAARSALSDELTKIRKFKKGLDLERKASFGV